MGRLADDGVVKRRALPAPRLTYVIPYLRQAMRMAGHQLAALRPGHAMRALEQYGARIARLHRRTAR